MGLIIFFAIETLVSIIYTIRHKEFHIVLNNVSILAFIIILKCISTYSTDICSIVKTLITCLTYILMIVLIINLLKKYKINKKLEKYQSVCLIITIIMIFFVYPTGIKIMNMQTGYAVPTYIDDEYGEYKKQDSQEFRKEINQTNSMMRLMFEIPIINIFFVGMFENKEKSIKDPNMKGESNG